MRWLSTGALLVGVASVASAQNIASRVSATKNAVVRMTFAARNGVCPMTNGPSVGYGAYGHPGFYGYGYAGSWVEAEEEWSNGCKGERVYVAMSVVSGQVMGIRTYVGGSWQPPKSTIVDLGRVSTRDAADYLVGLATESRHPGSSSAFFPAMLADSVVLWPKLIDVAEDTKRPKEARSWAVSMLRGAPGDDILPMLERIAEKEGDDRSVREAAVGALAGRPNNEGVPALIRIVKSTRESSVRRQAVQSLTSVKDPKVQAFLAELVLNDRQ